MKTIRRIVCNEISEDIRVLRLEEHELPDPAQGEVTVALRASAVNFPDILMVQGKYQHRPSLPFVPGGEGSGDVTAVGAGVSNLREGDAVVVTRGGGLFADAVNVAADTVQPLPTAMSYEEAAAFSIAYLTGYVALVLRGDLKPGENLLVHGASGGVGLAAVDLGKLLGANVIATGGNDDKLATVLARGADHVINYSLPDGEMGGFRNKVKTLTNGSGADVIYDPVGGSVFEESMHCISWGGRLLVIGFTSGSFGVAVSNLILIKQIAVIGVRAGEYGRRDPRRGWKAREQLFRLADEGKIHPHIHARVPLEEAVRAMTMLQKREVVGKVVLTMGSDST